MIWQCREGICRSFSLEICSSKLIIKEVDRELIIVGALDEDDTRWVFRNVGVQLSPQEVHLLMQAFDPKGTGKMSYNDLLSAISDPMSPQRAVQVNGLFNYLQTKLRGANSLENIARLYDAKKHPDFGVQGKNEKTIFDEYTKGWGEANPTIPIPEHAWIGFYSDVSSCVPDDLRFAQVIGAPFGLEP